MTADGQTVQQGDSLVTMYSTPWCGYCHRLRSQLDAAYADAERRFGLMELSPEQQQQGKDQAKAVVDAFASRLGWTLEIQW